VADVEALYRAATWNYGHFTSMQVRHGAVAGLDLHFRRLREGSAVLFPDAAPHSDDYLTELIGHALGDQRHASVRFTVIPSPTDRAVTPAMVTPPPGPATKYRCSRSSGKAHGRKTYPS
jgi:branched-subunit amino acid aminotransferase/4-amino-4-deoxychorismate lyase